jgi:dynein heavy chain 1, cytosolic
MKNYNKMI